MKPIRQKEKHDLSPFTVCVFLCAAVPAVVLLVHFIVYGCAPFGERSLCTMDAFSQYYPMLQNMARALKNGELFYSFSGGLGFNLWSQSAYYTNSPLWLIYCLVPSRARLIVLDGLVLLRFCLASVFFLLLLDSRKKTTERRILPYTALSVAYALCGWAVAFQNQFMWFDCMVVLPLVILGIEKLFKGKSPVLYTLSLFYCIYSCFYIAFMVCIFSVLWMLMLLLEEKLTFRQRAIKTGRFALYSALAGGMSAVSLLPLLNTISQTKASGLGFSQARNYGSVFGLLRMMLPFQEPSLEYGAPNVYCGLCAVILAILVLFCKKIPLRKRLIRLGLGLFLLLSFEIKGLNFFWHGFHFPNQLPGRFSFVYCFFILSCAASYFDYKAFVPTGKASSPVQMKRAAVILCSILLAEVCFSFDLRANSSPASLVKFSGEGSVLSSLKEEDEEFHRQELSPLVSNNQGLQYGYNGIGWYSSTMSEASYDFFQKLGLPKYAKNVSTYYEESDILNALFSIRYFADTETGEIRENKNVLPLAFLASEEVKSFDMEDREPESGEKTQKELWTAVCGEELSVKEGVKKLKSGGLKITDFRSDRIKGTIDCKTDGVLFSSIPDDGGWTITVDGVKKDTFRCAGLLLSCDMEKGTHTVEMRYIPPMFFEGLAVSLLCCAAFIALALIFQRKKKKALDTTTII